MLFFLMVVAVSIDAYLAGIAFSVEDKKTTFSVALSVGLYTILLCTLALVFGGFLSKYALFFKILGCIIFLVLGLKNLISALRKDGERLSVGVNTAGLGVSLDASLACLSMNVVGWGAILFCAACMALFHLVFVFLGMQTGKLVALAKNATIVSGVFLIILGVTKLL